MVEVLKTPKYPCSICKRKEATQFCDFVIGYGLLARTTTSKNDGRYSIWEVSGMNLQALFEKHNSLTLT
ncbi:hypothetical protein ACFVS2_04690 [Brevibacillus sp. NPDC058079]|uniref:hypothetical protein n=1 Tax=Brevibacillus sp. NPDC058079 TaxID=3346330 RepID=UPI0036F18BAE